MRAAPADAADGGGPAATRPRRAARPATLRSISHWQLEHVCNFLPFWSTVVFHDLVSRATAAALAPCGEAEILARARVLRLVLRWGVADGDLDARELRRWLEARVGRWQDS